MTQLPTGPHRARPRPGPEPGPPPSDFRARCAAALLATGPHAVLARETALSLHGCAAARVGALHVQVPYWAGARRHPGVLVHRGRVGEVHEVAGLPCQPLDAALCDVLCQAARHVALACADEVLSGLPADRRAGVRAAVRARVAARADPRGTRRAPALLALASGGSPGRGRLLLALVDAGLPPPEQHHPVPSATGVHLADFAWPAAGLALDCAAGRPAPAVRGAAGWTLLRAGPEDLRNPATLIARITRCLHARLVPGRPAARGRDHR